MNQADDSVGRHRHPPLTIDYRQPESRLRLSGLRKTSRFGRLRSRWRCSGFRTFETDIP